jgi:hypothetical protein|tara:strand:- start:43859 stop:45370 length:1512 start_codon:yes stop_codon:yes gene_type:complete
MRYNHSVNAKRFHQLSTFLLIAAILVAAVGLLSRVWYELSSGVLHGDAQIFQTVARGMLNGLTPYADLFETKPPGIFLLHALSLKLFGNQFLVKLLQAIALLGIPILVVVPSITFVQDRTSVQRRIISLTSILFGLLLALYTANQAGEGLTESYGAFFAITFFIVLITHHKSRISRSIILGILMLLSVGLKEPFLLIILAGVLLLKKDLLTSFFYPFCIAVVLGFIALLALGLAAPFFQIYLPHMLGYHVVQHKGSLFVYALEVWRTFINIGAYSWWLAIGITGLWLAVFVRMRAVGSWQLAVSWLVGSYLMFIAIATGGDFYGHHFIFAVPLYIVFWWVLLQHLPEKVSPIIVSGFVALLVATSFLSTRFSYKASAQSWNKSEQEMKSVAAVVDTVMERCNWEKYLQMIPRGGGPYAYTKTSPYGPIFVHYSRFIGANPLYQSAYIRALKNTEIALVQDIENSNFTEYTLQYVRSNFTNVPPACVGGDFEQPAPFQLLFRRS